MTNKEQLLDQALTQLLDLGFGDFDDVDILDTLSADRVMAIGTTIDELLFSRLSVKEMIQRQKEQSRGMKMHYSQSELFRHVSPTGRSALIVTDLKVFLVINSQNLELYVRFSTVFEWQDGRWTIVHFHASKPDNVESEKDTFGIEELKQKTVELEKMVSERTAELVLKNQELSNTISQLKSTQAQLIQSEKMASLGELTAGIAHEIQNPLNFVNNFSDVNIELIEELKGQRLTRLRNASSGEEANPPSLSSGGQSGQWPDDENALLNDISQNLEKIAFHGKRADQIVKSMLQHSRSSSGQKELTDINALADEYLRLAYHGYRAKDKTFNVQFETDFDPSLPKLNVVPQDIGRVLLNLINNAFYACNERAKQSSVLSPQSSAITNHPSSRPKADQPLAGITHESAANSQQPIANSQYQPTVNVSTRDLSDKIEIRVKDNGNGIPQHVLDKIFQPFFTTKPTGQGTGLGLSLSYDIVKAHNGEIKVETKEAEGTSFIIQLPL